MVRNLSFVTKQIQGNMYMITLIFRNPLENGPIHLIDKQLNLAQLIRLALVRIPATGQQPLLILMLKMVTLIVNIE